RGFQTPGGGGPAPPRPPTPAGDSPGEFPLPRRAPPDTRAFLILSPDPPPAEMAQALAARYGRQRDELASGKLRRTDLPLEPEVFRRLDRNGDGVLDLTELEAFADRPADVELKVRLGARAEGAALLAGPPPRRKPA